MSTGARPIGPKAKPRPGAANSPAWITMNESFSDVVKREHAKRERNWNPQLRWKVLQETIDWAAAQKTVRRNTKEACLANQQRLLGAIARYQQSARGD